MMRLLTLPVSVPVPTPVERAVLRLALCGWYPPEIAARLGLDECEVDALLRRLAKMYLEDKHETTNRFDCGSGNAGSECDRSGYGHGAAIAESVLRFDHEAGV